MNKTKRIYKYIFITLLLLLILLKVALNTATQVELFDYYCMKATGDYLIENHFSAEAFHQNPFTVNELGAVFQQWAYCIIISFVDRFQPFSVLALVLFHLILYFGTVFLYTKEHKLSSLQTTLIIAATTLFWGLSAYSNTPRPEVISIVLLMLQTIITEKAISKKNGIYFYILPAIMLLEINIHGSFWIFHFIFLLPYIVPSILKKLTIKSNITDKKILVHLGIASILMAAATFINPYGIDMPLYIIHSFIAKTFSYVTVYEMLPPTKIDIPAIGTVTLFIVFIVCLYKKWLRSSTFYFAIGLCFASMMAIRNYMFLVFPVIMIFTDVFKSIKQLEFSVKIKDILPVLCCVLMLGFLVFTRIQKYMINEAWIDKDGIPKTVEYLDKNYQKDDRIFTSFSAGSYLEYKGYTNIYIDTRPELYMKQINKKKDVLVEYNEVGRRLSPSSKNSLSAVFSSSDQTSDEEKNELTKKRIEEFINYYDFDCYIVSEYESALYHYLLYSDQYQMIMSESEFFVFEKIF